MSSDWRDYDTHIMQQGRSRNHTFHSTDECARIDNNERSVDRSESFLAFHEPEPCEYCHDDVESETTDGDPECKVTHCETTVAKSSAFCSRHKLLDDDRLVTDGGTDTLTTTCVECGTSISRARAMQVSVHTELPDGGYEFIQMPACHSCKLKREGIPCDHCGELHRTQEAAYECCIGQTKAPDCKECGRRMSVASAGYHPARGHEITVAECDCCPVMWGRFTGWDLLDDEPCKHIEDDPRGESA